MSSNEAPVSTNDTTISRFNIANLVGYFLNVVITYAIGAAGIIPGLKTNSELSRKYQTLVTPVGWAFAIWGVIFVAQFIWTLYQVLARSQRNSPWVTAVGFNYLYVCLAQCAWTLAFSTEIIYLSVVCMVAILVFLVRAVVQLGKVGVEDDFSIRTYLLWKFPFTIHCGWITAATIVNINVLLVYLNVPASTQFYVAFACLLSLLAVAAFLLVRNRTDLVIPTVLVWALWGVYNELKSPDENMIANFTSSQIDQTRDGSFAVFSLIASGVAARTAVEIYRQCKKRRPEGSEEEGAYLRAERMSL